MPQFLQIDVCSIASISSLSRASSAPVCLSPPIKNSAGQKTTTPTVVAIASFVRCLSCAPAAIAVTAKSRLAQAPKILTVDEAGLPGFYVSNWGGLWAPKGTPRNVIAKLNVAVVDALADPALAMETAEDPVKFLRDNKQSKGGPQLITMVKPVVSNKKAFEGPADACSPQSDCEKANRDLMTDEPGQPR